MELEGPGGDPEKCKERAEEKAGNWTGDCDGDLDAGCEARVAAWLDEKKSICDMERGCEKNWANRINNRLLKCEGNADCESFVRSIQKNENVCGECKPANRALKIALRKCDDGSDYVACERDAPDDVAEALKKCECKERALIACAAEEEGKDQRKCKREFKKTCLEEDEEDELVL